MGARRKRSGCATVGTWQVEGLREIEPIHGRAGTNAWVSFPRQPGSCPVSAAYLQVVAARLRSTGLQGPQTSRASPTTTPTAGYGECTRMQGSGVVLRAVTT